MGRWTRWMSIEEAKERNGRHRPYRLYRTRSQILHGPCN
jgi:hypothetical protein